MKKSRLLLIAVGLTFVGAMIIFLGSQEPIYGQACEIVKIHGGTEADISKIRLEPQTITVKKGSCVVWSNWVEANNVSVRFSDGKKCEANTDAPTLFKMDPKYCYVSQYIPYGGTSSLRFKERGTFQYLVEAKDMSAVTGEIRVE